MTSDQLAALRAAYAPEPDDYEVDADEAAWCWACLFLVLGGAVLVTVGVAYFLGVF